jgi:hypothetical protein
MVVEAENEISPFEKEGLIIEPIDEFEEESIAPEKWRKKGPIQKLKEFFIVQKNIVKEKQIFQLFDELEKTIQRSIFDEHHWLESFDQGKMRPDAYNQDLSGDDCREIGALGIVKYLLKNPVEIHRDRLNRMTKELKLVEEFRQWVDVLGIPAVEESLKKVGPQPITEIIKARDFNKIALAISTFLEK